MNQTPEQHYRENLEKVAKELTDYRSRILRVGWLRVLVIVGGIAGAWFLAGIHGGYTAISVVVTLGVFLALVRMHLRLQERRDHLQCLQTINENELKALAGDSSEYEDGAAYVNPDHEFTYDLDIFGEGSIYQHIERCGTLEGRKMLAGWLGTPELNTETIKQRQEAVKEISEASAWRQDLYAYGLLSGEQKGAKDRIVKLLARKERLMNSFLRVAMYLVPVLSVAAIVLYNLDVINDFQLLLYAFIPFGLVGMKLKKFTKLASELSKSHDLINNYAKLIFSIEEKGFKSEALKRAKEEFKTNGLPAHRQLMALSKVIGAVESRNNLFVGILLNFLLVYDLHCINRVEKWLDEFADEVGNWIEGIGVIEVYSSLGNMHYNAPEQIFPEALRDGPLLEMTGTGHPLLQANERVNNDFELKKNGQFSIITGANMAGKSTFLRSVGVNLVLAMAGGSVVAERFKFRPVTLYSSMRTSDSLQKNQSYFHSELLRLKGLVDHLQKGQPTFIILDEILKGTNSKDKASGSKAFVDRLLTLKASGIIATHDLSLCELDKKYPEDVFNQSFEVDIKGDQMHCDYKLRHGVCQNMNATFLMKNMGITHDLQA
jgi:hypothetical protein